MKRHSTYAQAASMLILVVCVLQQTLAQVCPPGYYGDRCGFPICFGVPANSQKACTGRGICVRPDVCLCFYPDSDENCRPVCPPGFAGPRCSFPVCWGIPSFDAKVCSGRGVCKAKDTCVCSPGWIGERCDIPTAPPTDTCFGLIATNPAVCSGHGNCIGTDRCSCNQGWSGSKCESPVCFGIPAYDRTVCSAAGTCTGPDTCVCIAGHEGQRCQTPTVTPPSDILCFGLSAGDPNVCSGHGTCIAQDQCQCSAGWSGLQCNQGVCPAGFTGTSCNIPICFSQPANDPNVCNGHGRCVGPDQCQCDAGWSGDRCNNGQQPPQPPADIICFGMSAGDPNVCSGHGTCVGQDQCQCVGGWTGPQCNDRICPAGFTGSNCDIPICFSQPANDPNVCSGHGRCTGPDQCSCQPGWVGDRCNTPQANTGTTCSNTQCPAGELCCDDTLVGALCYRPGEHTCTNIGNGRFRFCCCGTCLPCGDDLRCFNTRTHHCVNGQVMPGAQ